MKENGPSAMDESKMIYAGAIADIGEGGEDL
jgi:hypothetical protein